jgi:hypothetical protein
MAKAGTEIAADVPTGPAITGAGEGSGALTAISAAKAEPLAAMMKVLVVKSEVRRLVMSTPR